MPHTEATREVEIPARWTSSLSTMVTSFGPRSWEDVEATLDHLLTGTPALPPRLDGGRARERSLSGYETAHRVVLSGLADVPPAVVLRWARLRLLLVGPAPRTMMPTAAGVVEVLLDDMATVFDAPRNPVPVDVAVLEAMVEQAGLPATSVLLSAFQPGPQAQDPLPSRACETLVVMRGYDEALVRHAAVMRLHLMGFDPRGQVRATRMLAHAATGTLRVYAEAVATLAESAEPTVRAAARPLVQRIEASHPHAPLVDEVPPLHGPLLDEVPHQRPPLADWGALGRRMSRAGVGGTPRD